MTMNEVLARFAGRPLAMAPGRLDALIATNVAGFAFDRPKSLTTGYAVGESGIALVPVVGPLVSRSDWLSELFGAMSYGDVGDSIEDAFSDTSARAVLLELDSPGGEIGGLFDLVDRIAALRNQTGKPLWAAASEAALSAAYAIASTAERIYVTRTAEVGSIGVVAVHLDQSAADAMEGLKWTLIHAGARKVDGNPHEPLSGEALSAIQGDVDTLQEQFVALVAKNRGLTPDAVRVTEAAVYRGALGITAGFADRLGSLDAALADLSAELNEIRVSGERANRTLTPRTERTMTMTTDTQVGEQPAIITEPTASSPVLPQVPEPPATAEPVPAAVAMPAAESPAVDRLRAEFAEIAAVAAQAARLGVAVDAADAMRKGVGADALRRTVLDALAARAEATNVVTTAPAAPAANESPIVRRARERAGQSNTGRP